MSCHTQVPVAAQLRHASAVLCTPGQEAGPAPGGSRGGPPQPHPGVRRHVRVVQPVPARGGGAAREERAGGAAVAQVSAQACAGRVEGGGREVRGGLAGLRGLRVAWGGPGLFDLGGGTLCLFKQCLSAGAYMYSSALFLRLIG